MGSSKKHKEKKDKKKHKRERSRSRERDGHRKSKDHKSSHRRDKDRRRSPDQINSEIENASRKRQPVENTIIRPEAIKQEKVSDDEFDVDKLLDSKLSENPEFSGRLQKKRKREGISELLRSKRLQLPGNDDSLERFATQQLEEDSSRHHATTSETNVSIKEENANNAGMSSRTNDKDPSLSSIILEANKLRAKLGMKLLDVEKETSVKRDESHTADESRKSSSRKTVSKPAVEDDEGPSEPQLSLSIAETNKLRAKLGLKPLDVGTDIPGIDAEEKEISKPAAEVFVRTENIAEKKRSEALREKLKVIKDKRTIEEKLRKTKGVADSDSEEESAASWVIKHQKILQEKEAAEKRAKLLEEMDAEFGVSALVDEEFGKDKAYTSHNLKGMTIGHDAGSFKEGHQVILTLKDKGVLEEDDDVLENVNLIDNERHAKNVENRKKKPDYKPYDEPEYDEFGILKKKNLLSKYDEEIEGQQKKTFKIGEAGGSYVSKEQEMEIIRMKLKQQNEISLEMPDLRIANEYLTPAEMVKFKKPKKKRKIRKLKADDLLTDEPHTMDFGSRRRGRTRDSDAMDDVDPSSAGIPGISNDEEFDLGKVKIEEDETEFQGALNKAKKLKERKAVVTAPEKVLEILQSASGSSDPRSLKGRGDNSAVNIEMNSVAEFCRTLGDIPTYGMSGNRDEEVEDIMDLERETVEERLPEDLDPQNQGAWNEVDIEERPAEIAMRENEPILEEEPLLFLYFLSFTSSTSSSLAYLLDCYGHKFIGVLFSFVFFFSFPNKTSCFRGGVVLRFG